MNALDLDGTAVRKVLVVGIGNPDRCDDGIGAAVLERLAGRLPADVRTLARRGDMLALLDDCAGADALVCVDATAPMGMPGQIRRIDAIAETVPRDASFASSHALGLGEAIELARTLGTAPPAMVVYAVEGACFDDGMGLSPLVARAIEEVADRVVADVARLRRGPASPAPEA